MGISPIRKATEEDYERLNKAATRFAKRHGIRLLGEDLPDDMYKVSPATELGEYLSDLPDYDNGPYLRKLWLPCFRRALKEPTADAIAHGYIGWAC